METLWAPWRYAYVSGKETDRAGVPHELTGWPGPDTGCVFCNMLGSVQWAIAKGVQAEEAQRTAGILRMGKTCFVCLNAFPYTSGHVMIVPYDHLSSLAELPSEAAVEMIHTAQSVERSLRAAYSPGGLNLGCNLGEAAGAGIASHLHLHALPRWSGDTNFMTTVGQVRVAPEDLAVTWRRLRPLLTEEATREDAILSDDLHA